jgi:hypothetical protein
MLPAHQLTAAATAGAAAHQSGWRARLWRFLFPGEDAVGVEEAVLHYRHDNTTRVPPPTTGVDAVGGQLDKRSGFDKGTAADPTMRCGVQDCMEPWHYMQVPLSRVILFLRLQQRLADQWAQALMYAPFFVMLMLFTFVGPARGNSQFTVDFRATRRDSFALAEDASQMREKALLEAFRLNTEATVVPTVTGTTGVFVPGNSAHYSWMYSWFNKSVNVWTAPLNQRTTVDAQIQSVAATHHEPTFLSLSSIRTRRDVLRWLQLQLVPRLWSCKSPNFERPWRSTVTGGHYQLGAARLISRRYQQSTLSVMSNPQDGVKSVSVAGAGYKSAGVQTAEDVHNAKVGTLIIANKRASPPGIPESICGPKTGEGYAELNPHFHFNNDVGGYVALLPFATSCSAVRAVLSVMETPKQDVIWPPLYRNSLEMREAWMDYTETDRATNTSVLFSSSTCASFLFNPAVSEVLLQYVEYGTRTNRYKVVEVRFAMSSSGAVVRPQLLTYSFSALRWQLTFTPLVLSITLALTILFYGNYLLRRMLAQYTAKMSRVPRPRRTRTQGLWCATLVFLHMQNLVHLLALILAAATIGSWWHTLVRITNVPVPRYANRDEYPEAIDRVVRQAGVLLPRLCACAVFFATSGLLRFTSMTPGLWAANQTLARTVPRLIFIFCVWMTVNTGVAMMCVLLYGSALYEFSTFGRAFTMLLFMFLDGGRSMMNSFSVARDTGHYSILPQDDMLPRLRGSRLGRLEPVPLDQRSVTLSMSSLSIYPVFLLFFFYVQSVVIVVWGTSTVVEGYRNVLLLPEAGVLPLWRGLWPLQLMSLTRTLNAEYAKEALRRLLLSRGEAVMLRDIDYYLRLGYARTAAARLSSLSTTAASQHHVGRDDAKEGEDGDSPFYDGAGDPAVSLTMVLWLLPRELQPEYGAAHLRRLWYLCVASALSAQRREQPWKAAQWHQHWDRHPGSLSGWLRASLPEGDTIEEQAARVGMQLEELPNSVVRYVEGKFM